MLERTEANEPVAAFTQFELSLKNAPNQFRGLYGAARAAQLSGDLKKASAYYSKLVDQCRSSDTIRPAIAEARVFLARRGMNIKKR